MNDKQLIQIMKSLTGWHTPKYNIYHVCVMSPPNWYAFIGLMETYEIRYIKGNKFKSLVE